MFTECISINQGMSHISSAKCLHIIAFKLRTSAVVYLSMNSKKDGLLQKSSLFLYKNVAGIVNRDKMQ